MFPVTLLPIPLPNNGLLCVLPAFGYSVLPVLGALHFDLCRHCYSFAIVILRLSSRPIDLQRSASEEAFDITTPQSNACNFLNLVANILHRGKVARWPPTQQGMALSVSLRTWLHHESLLQATTKAIDLPIRRRTSDKILQTQLLTQPTRENGNPAMAPSRNKCINSCSG